MKTCIACHKEMPLAAFYSGTGPARKGHSSRCRKCFNEQCRRRVAGDAAYKARQYAAKKRWEQRFPERKAIHEGRTIVLHREDAPPELREAEKFLLKLNQAIFARRNSRTCQA